MEKHQNENPPLSALVELSPLMGLFSLKKQKSNKKVTSTFMPINFKLAKIHRGKNGSRWFVYYSFLHPGEFKFKRIIVFEGINYIKDLAEKEKFANDLKDAINKKLKDGYSPYQLEEVNEAEQELRNLKKQKVKVIDPFLTDAFIEFLNQKEDKNRSKQTLQSYRSYIAKFECYLIAGKSADIRLSELNTTFITSLMQWIEQEYKLGATTYNNHINFWVTLINWFEKKPRQWVKRTDFDFGLDTDLENKKENILKHQYYTASAMERVKLAMSKHPLLLYYAKFIYYSCMRPDEIRNLQIENIDLSGRMIKIVGKTGNRVIPICDELYQVIEERNINASPMSFYLIGADGLVNKSMHSENFFARVFRDNVRNEAGLSSNFTLYGFKHSRVIHLLQAGYTDSEVMQLTGHRDSSSFDKYKRDLMGNIDSKLKGKTILF